jgi:hypothetical protein
VKLHPEVLVPDQMQRKFPGVDPSLSLHAMTYFKDVEHQPMPEMLIKITWADVKKGLVRVRERGPQVGRLDR